MKTNKISVTVYEQRTIEITPVYPAYFVTKEKYTKSYYRFTDESDYTIAVPNINCIYFQKNGSATMGQAHANMTPIDVEEFVEAVHGIMERLDKLVGELETEFEQETMSDFEKRQLDAEAREQDMCDQQQDN